MANGFNFTFTSTRTLAGALAAALILVASVNFLWWRVDVEATEQANLVNHTHQVIASLEETLARADDMVIGHRGYALTREVEFLDSYFAATNRMPQLLHNLRQLVCDNPTQAALLSALEPKLEAYEGINREHIASLNTGDPLAPDLEFRRTVRAAMGAIRSQVTEMISVENQLLTERQESSRDAARVVTAVNIIAGLVSMGLIAAVFIALWRQNARRQAIEVELRRSHLQLEDRVRERTSSLIQSEAERKRLEQEMLETIDNEMRRIGHDLHDGVGQQLTALSLFASGVQKEAEAGAPAIADSCKKIAQELKATIRQVRVLSHGLSPVSLDAVGLAEALRKLAGDTRLASDVVCEFQDTSQIHLQDPYVAAQLYRIGQEAVTNALKHSGAKRIHISLQVTNAQTELKISDDGRGFDSPEINGHGGLGFRAMKHRADVIGAVIQIDSTPGSGTQLTCTRRN